MDNAIEGSRAELRSRHEALGVPPVPLRWITLAVPIAVGIVVLGLSGWLF